MGDYPVFYNVDRETRRNEIRLPELYYVAGTDWIPKLGRTTFSVWIEMHTKTLEDGVVPMSMAMMAKEFGMSRVTFYKYIKILWNYGMIDLEEKKDDSNPGQKSITIIVYEFPFNDINRRTMPLEKLRDYDQDYRSDARMYATGEKKKEQ